MILASQPFAVRGSVVAIFLFLFPGPTTAGHPTWAIKWASWYGAFEPVAVCVHSPPLLHTPRQAFHVHFVSTPSSPKNTQDQTTVQFYRLSSQRKRERERKGERESSDDTAATTAHSKSTCPCSTTLTGHVHPRSKRFPAGTRQENSKQARLKFAALVLLFSGTVQTYPGINRRNVIVKKRIDNRIVSIIDEQ